MKLGSRVDLRRKVKDKAAVWTYAKSKWKLNDKVDAMRTYTKSEYTVNDEAAMWTYAKSKWKVNDKAAMWTYAKSK